MVGSHRLSTKISSTILALLSTPILLLAAVAATAQVPPRPEQDPAQRLLQEQRDQQRQRDLAQPAPEVSVPSAPPAIPNSSDIESIAEPGQAFEIDRIQVTGNKLLLPSELDYITKPFIGKHLGSQRINLLLRRFTEVFVSRGLITTRAYLGKQNLSSGTLVVTMMPGIVEAIRLNDQTLASLSGDTTSNKTVGGGWLTDLGVRMALPTAPGKVLNMSDLEQGVEQINRLRRNKAEMQILPGTAPGSSIIGLTNKSGDRLWYSAGMDNYGSQQTGLNRTRLGVEADNLLGFEEVFSFNFVGSRETNAIVASAAVPYGYNTFSYTASLSEYQSLIGDTALLYGSTVSDTFGWNRVLSRSQAAKTALDTTLSLRRASRDINDLMLDPQVLSVLRIGINTLRRWNFRERPASWTLDVGISEGLNAFGASQDDNSALAQGDAHSQFTKFDFNGTLSLPLFDVASASFSLASQISGQWSSRGLFGSEQLYVGGMSTVRGYRESGISGDRGIYMRNEIVWNNAPKFADIRLEPYVFYDTGATELISEDMTRKLSGAGIGVRLEAQYKKQSIAGEVTLGRPIQQPDFLDPKSTLLLATINWNY